MRHINHRLVPTAAAYAGERRCSPCCCCCCGGGGGGGVPHPRAVPREQAVKFRKKLWCVRVGDEEVCVCGLRECVRVRVYVYVCRVSCVSEI